MNTPQDLKYTQEHEWIKKMDEEDVVLVGITDFAQSELGDIVYVEVDTVGDELKKDEIFGTVEAVKTTSDLYMPLDGEVLEFNSAIDEDEDDDPALINESPYDQGWIIKIRMTSPEQFDELLDAAAYTALIS
ncbi:glycine cleavage system protein GcvH [Membranicola marinus]|uniref:Glycine cleavage system H protein n=1 Tax=Membranihabitans marinus TaxID=1227546 RepID=A0A953L865_9BACT|nr:glycine cleavage system protein GcvH [Membranihabitans marinus]MBY5959472.1 glycine cleavage system protein GcvH [Membranihabitans marinus]